MPDSPVVPSLPKASRRMRDKAVLLSSRDELGAREPLGPIVKRISDLLHLPGANHTAQELADVPWSHSSFGGDVRRLHGLARKPFAFSQGTSD
jgi:hypothetical protein